MHPIGSNPPPQAAEFRDKVTDPQGRFVSRAVVTIRNADLAFQRTVVTDKAGSFGAALLPAGTYIIGVSAPGLILKHPARLTLNVGGGIRLSLQLSLPAWIWDSRNTPYALEFGNQLHAIRNFRNFTRPLVPGLLPANR